MSRLARASVLTLCLVATRASRRRARKAGGGRRGLSRLRKPDRVKAGERPAPFLARADSTGDLDCRAGRGGPADSRRHLAQRGPAGLLRPHASLGAVLRGEHGANTRSPLRAEPRGQTQAGNALGMEVPGRTRRSGNDRQTRRTGRGPLSRRVEGPARAYRSVKTRAHRPAIGSRAGRGGGAALGIQRVGRPGRRAPHSCGDSRPRGIARIVGGTGDRLRQPGIAHQLLFQPGSQGILRAGPALCPTAAAPDQGIRLALWHRAYVRTLVGLHHLAELDVAAAKDWQTKTPKARPAPFLDRRDRGVQPGPAFPDGRAGEDSTRTPAGPVFEPRRGRLFGNRQRHREGGASRRPGMPRLLSRLGRHVPSRATEPGALRDQSRVCLAFPNASHPAVEVRRASRIHCHGTQRRLATSTPKSDSAQTWSRNSPPRRLRPPSRESPRWRRWLR